MASVYENRLDGREEDTHREAGHRNVIISKPRAATASRKGVEAGTGSPSEPFAVESWPPGLRQ